MCCQHPADTWIYCRQDIVAFLESNFFDMMRTEIHNIQSDANIIGGEGHGHGVKNEKARENRKRKADDNQSSKLYDKKSRFTQ